MKAQVTLIGRISKIGNLIQSKYNPEIEILPFQIGVNGVNKGQEIKMYYDCLAFSAKANYIFKNLQVGDQVYFEGTLEPRTILDKNQSGMYSIITQSIMGLESKAAKEDRKKRQAKVSKLMDQDTFMQETNNSVISSKSNSSIFGDDEDNEMLGTSL
ncbi:Single-strand binding protein family [Mycoplasmopsis citelli]|uniref:Single-stranded DNA-binding protein n=1 Tax=Mycoplasmopsis citelli TaxID=171281 RepID=A0A449B174_9BACT|nr:single-stranded DNA-binding protein [Mycoplasmopsis citelli]VEU74294.1 Single-strand binding protein family [Mycoplasmopsis citelli]